MYMTAYSVTVYNTTPHDYRYMNTIRLSYVDSYKHFKVTNVRIVSTLLLTRHLLFKGTACFEEKRSS